MAHPGPSGLRDGRWYTRREADGWSTHPPAKGGFRLNPPAAATARGIRARIDFGAYVWPAALLIVLLAFAARVYNVDWDAGAHLHPDERHLSIVAEAIELPSSVGGYFDSDSSTLNPYNARNAGSFVYGTLPLFLAKATAALLGRDSYDEMVLVGRHLAALFDAGSVLLAFLIGRRLYGATAGIIAASLLATAPLAIQQSHFLVVDPFLTFFTTASLYYAVAITQEGRPAHYGLAGLALGLGLACKVTAAVIAPVVLVAVLIRLWPNRPWAPRIAGDATDSSRRATRAALLGLGLVLLAAFLAFRVAQPYAFETPSFANLGLEPASRWINDQRGQSRLLGGDVPFPPSVQWIDRASYLFPLQQMLTWGMAPAFGIAGWGGLLFAAYRLGRLREARQLLPVLFVLVYFAFMGRQFSLYLRYFLPLYPVLAVLAGHALVEALRQARELSTRHRRPEIGAAAGALVALVLIGSLAAGLAYLSIYTRPVTRLAASAWMYDNLPAASRIAGEHWDDPLPLRPPGAPDKGFELFELPLYDLDTPDKVSRLIQGLDRADYLVLSSNRLINSIPRNPQNYPVTSRYYDLLLEEQLGFRLLREFTSYPGLLGIEAPDHATEEAWSSYDHPRVLLFQKTASYSSQRVATLLGRGPFASVGLTPAQSDRNGLLLSDADLAAQRRGGSWSSVFSDSGIARSQPTLLWLAVLELAALAVTPLAFVLCRRLPDRGYLLAKPLGLLLLAYPVWLVVSLKLAPFSQTTILAILVTLLCLGGVLLARRWTETLGFLRDNWRLLLFCEALFLLAFLGFRELRLENPDIWHPLRGGEKPMDLAFLTAVTRSTTLPPYDPWFAGGYINYYYLGQFFTASLSKATTIPPEVAFNLAVPTFFALTVAAAFSLCFNLATAARGFRRRIPGWSAYAGGLLGVCFIAIAGNLDGIDQLAERLAAVSSWRIDTPAPLLDAVVNGGGGVWRVLFHGASLPDFDYWRSSRVLPPSIAITEFPFFSFLFADLHAHMMAIPFQVLTLGVCLSLALGRPGERRAWQEWALVALLGLIVGSLRWLNSWDYPPFLLIALTALVINERRLEGGIEAALARLGLKALLLAGLSFLLFQPFLAGYQTPVSGLQASPETTPPLQYLTHFGIFAAVLGVWLLYPAARSLRRYRSRAGGRGDQAADQTAVLTLGAAALMLVLAMTLLIVLGQALFAVLLPALLAVGWLALRELQRPRADGGLRLFVLALIALGLGLSIGVDLVAVKGDIVRMNTVFKFYLHAWVVFAAAAAFAAWQLIFVYWRPALVRHGRRAPRYVACAGLIGLACMTTAGLVYPLFATPARLDDRFAELPRTLDGMAYMREAVYTDARGTMDLRADYDGIQWLRRNVAGTPAIVEGRTDLYRWGSRFSIYTGLPAVLGWDWHEKQQRGDLAVMVDQRAAEVDQFYASPEVAQALGFLRRYDVSYVIVGQLERIYYPAAGLRKFESGLNGALEVAYSNAGLTIYRVGPEGGRTVSP